MKSDFGLNSSYLTRELDPDKDWEAFKDHMLRTHGENNYTGFIGEAEAEDPDSWKSEMRRYVQFGLFCCEELVGSTALFSRNNGQEIVFTGSIIEEKHRGNCLADNLYGARFSYVRQSGLTGNIIVEIQDNNDRSLNAAKRNGFEEKDELIQSGEGYYARYIVFQHPSLN